MSLGTSDLGVYRSRRRVGITDSGARSDRLAFESSDSLPCSPTSISATRSSRSLTTCSAAASNRALPTERSGCDHRAFRAGPTCSSSSTIGR
jgi:hypothetical protein